LFLTFHFHFSLLSFLFITFLSFFSYSAAVYHAPRVDATSPFPHISSPFLSLVLLYMSSLLFFFYNTTVHHTARVDATSHTLISDATSHLPMRPCTSRCDLAPPDATLHLPMRPCTSLISLLFSLHLTFSHVFFISGSYFLFSSLSTAPPFITHHELMRHARRAGKRRIYGVDYDGTVYQVSLDCFSLFYSWFGGACCIVLSFLSPLRVSTPFIRTHGRVLAKSVRNGRKRGCQS
jgi:hypothetical protein